MLDSRQTGATEEPAEGEPRKRLELSRWWRTATFTSLCVWLGPFVAAILFVKRLPHPQGLQAKYVFALVALIVPVAIARLVARRSTVAVSVGASLAATFPALALMLALRETRWYLCGAVGDQTFRLESVTRFTQTAALHDYTYAAKPAFYPP